MNTPVKDMLEAYAKKKACRFHMPGHKGAYTPNGAHDITELYFSDDLYSASGVLKSLEDTLAARAKSKRCLMLTDGSSAGVRIIFTVLKRHCGNKRILLADNCHRSAVDGCILADIRPEIMPIAKLINSIDPSVGAVFITSPDYYGNMLDVKAISQKCKSYGVILAQDEAHGAHLPYIGMPSGSQYADISVQSMHKTMGALTQGATLNVNHPSLIDSALYARRMLCTSSPSYLIMESMEWASNYYARCASDFTKKVAALRLELADICSSTVSDFALLDTNCDPTRICLKTKNTSGFEVSALFQKQNVIPEMADCNSVVFILTPHDGDYTYFKRVFSYVCTNCNASPAPQLPQAPKAGKFLISMRQAAMSPTSLLPLTEAQGKISAACAGLYPPGIPCVYPGQEITDEVINYLQACSEIAEVFGLSDGKIAVCN